jgi:hypothetical protein
VSRGAAQSHGLALPTELDGYAGRRESKGSTTSRDCAGIALQFRPTIGGARSVSVETQPRRETAHRIQSLWMLRHAGNASNLDRTKHQRNSVPRVDANGRYGWASPLECCSAVRARQRKWGAQAVRSPADLEGENDDRGAARKVPPLSRISRSDGHALLAILFPCDDTAGDGTSGVEAE